MRLLASSVTYYWPALSWLKEVRYLCLIATDFGKQEHVFGTKELAVVPRYSRCNTHRQNKFRTDTDIDGCERHNP